MTEKKILLLKKKEPLSAPAPAVPAKVELKLKPRTSTRSGVVSGEIDLRTYLTRVAGPSVDEKKGKDKIINVLGQLVSHTEAKIQKMTGDEKKRNQFRATQFKKAISSLQAHPGEIASKAEAMKLPNIGKGIAERIDEIIKTGTLVELSQSTTVSPIDQLINELTTVTGIGESHARKFIEQGITSLDDLKVKSASGAIRLTHHMEVGLKYYHDIQQKIAYREVSDLKETLYKIAHATYPQVLVQVCGSHRRGKAFSGDIDVLITNPEIRSEEDLIRAKVPYLKTIVAQLKQSGFLVADLTTHGDTKYMGVCMHPEYKIGRRIDIRFVAYDSYYPALLYFTGSMMTNKLMRTIALDKGYTLNEYGLYRYAGGVKGEKITVESEEEIFRILGISYLEPNQREL